MDEVEQIKDRLSVEEVVGEHVQLKQAGRNFKGLCPFHSEKTPSFMVSPEKGIWHCFGCGEGGDIFKFVMKIDGLEFRQALETLGKRAGVEIKSGDGGAAAKQKERLRKLMELAVTYYQFTLLKNKTAKDYLMARDLKIPTIKEFRLGYAPRSEKALLNFLIKKDFSEAEIIRAGLASKRTDRVFDMFRARIIFPIADEQNRPVGITARVLDDSLPKYINTPQTLIYDKSRIIFGYSLAKEAIKQKDEVVIVEGNMDVIASHQVGVKQTVAVSGTALTLDQLKILSRLTKNIKLSFDQDIAGLGATKRAIELSQKLGLTLSIIDTEGAKDPDTLIKKDPKLWQQAVAKAQYVMDWLFGYFETQYDLNSALGKRRFSDQLASNIKYLQDPVEKNHYIKLLAQKTAVDIEAIKQKVADTNNDKSAEVATFPDTKDIEQNRRTTIEEAFLAINLAYPEARLSLEDVSSKEFFDADRSKIISTLKKHKELSDADLTKLLPELSDYVKILAFKGEQLYTDLESVERSFEAFNLAKDIQKESNLSAREKLSIKLKNAEETDDKKLIKKLQQEFQELSLKAKDF